MFSSGSRGSSSASLWCSRQKAGIVSLKSTYVQDTCLPPSPRPQLLSFLKAGFLLYRNYHLHDNAPGVYKPLTLPRIPLFLPQCGAYHYTVHTGTRLNAKRVIRINRVAFSFQTSLVLGLVLFSTAVWSLWSASARRLLATVICQSESWGSSISLTLLFDLPPCTFNPVCLCL